MENALEAMELFVFGHEYGHHVLGHGKAETTEKFGGGSDIEHESDFFACAVSMAIGSNTEPQNLFAMSGGGAVIALCSIDIVRRARHLLLTGKDESVDGEHPPISKRIEYIGVLDNNAPSKDYRDAFADVRSCFMKIFVGVWDIALPILRKLFAEGIHPLDAVIDTAWLGENRDSRR